MLTFHPYTHPTPPELESWWQEPEAGEHTPSEAFRDRVDEYEARRDRDAAHTNHRTYR